MSDKQFRIIEMLQLIPKAPGKITARSLMEALTGLGYTVEKRTIERDLQKLSGRLPLLCDEREKPFGWSFDASSHYGKSTLSTEDALATLLANEYLAGLFPEALHTRLSERAKEANALLHYSPQRQVKDWRKKVALLRSGYLLLPAEVSPAVLSVVYTALFQGRQLVITYRDKPDQRVNPLGLVLRNQAIYLIATYWNYKDIRQLAAHRISTAQIHTEPSVTPTGFSLENYIKSSAMGVLYKTPEIHITLNLTESLARLLEETPLASDQKITQTGDTFRLQASVANTLELRQWLMSQAQELVVLSPKELRKDIEQRLHDALMGYSKAN